MKKIIIDVENTIFKINEKYRDFSPYRQTNRLVSVGWAGFDNDVLQPIKYLFLYHNELKEINRVLLDELKNDLEQAEVIVGFNIKYDAQWLLEAGFDLDHHTYEDCMIREYVMARGRTDISFKLSDTCKRYKVADKGDIFERYPDKQISEMPIGEVLEYGVGDIQCTAELYLAQKERLKQDGYRSMDKTILMMEEFCKVLVSMERAGVKIDEEALKKVEEDFTDEAEKLKFDLNTLVKKYMGDSQVNLDSPQQLSEVIYSRSINSGKEEQWASAFNIGRDERNKMLKRPKMSTQEYVSSVKSMTHMVMKTNVEKCEACSGEGSNQKYKKNGDPWKKRTNCSTCKAKGVVYKEINEVAGFHMRPMNVYWTTLGGFTTSQTFLEELIEQAERQNKTDAKIFLEKLMRLSSVSSYLSNFVGGINAFKQADATLHPNYNQCITATGRLSSTKPNLQNQPRETTFPIRRVFVSRFSGGSITEVDFAQLEFRAAVHLAKDETGKEHILAKRDIHSQTAKIITEAGQSLTRQQAKSRTFKPLYGGTTGTEAEREYYRAFLKEIYTGIGAWHKELEEEAISELIVTIPTGRQFIFPDVARAWHGGCNKKTQVVNYPVQAFATADIVPIATIRLAKEMKKLGLKSLIVLNVHDSVVVDTYPGEEAAVWKLCANLGVFAEEELLGRYGITAFVPFEVEVKQGINLMELRRAA